MVAEHLVGRISQAFLASRSLTGPEDSPYGSSRRPPRLLGSGFLLIVKGDRGLLVPTESIFATGSAQPNLIPANESSEFLPALFL
ncbi:hypothetical protein K239x_10350 [Planctomycetes bacterium K23_9]|uniref:Uncharacterized protein n=1 Tax=Stieleria marina TaxID=1930275 RepID=A0A517NPQ3_9BACT|nr:hypothetical protein K239x_10350 [Planctomycetes bacterium K23_9]